MGKNHQGKREGAMEGNRKELSTKTGKNDQGKQEGAGEIKRAERGKEMGKSHPRKEVGRERTNQLTREGAAEEVIAGVIVRPVALDASPLCLSCTPWKIVT